MSRLLEEFTLRDMVLTLLTDEGRRRLDNRTKPNDQIFSEYQDVITATLSKAYAYESKRLLEQFRAEIGQLPPAIPLVMRFLARFKDRKSNTKARYAYIMPAFFKYSAGKSCP